MRAFVQEGIYLVQYEEIPLRPIGEPQAMAANFPAVVGQPVKLSIVAKDQDGITIPLPTTDSPPVWSNTAPTVDAIAAAADGLTAVDTCLSVGTDTVGLTVIVGGKTFTASMPLTVSKPPSVLTSVDILAA